MFSLIMYLSAQHGNRRLGRLAARTDNNIDVATTRQWSIAQAAFARMQARARATRNVQ